MMFLRIPSDVYENCLMDGNILNVEYENYQSNQQRVCSKSFIRTCALKQNITSVSLTISNETNAGNASHVSHLELQ